MAKVALFDTVRRVLFGGLSGTYAPLGTPLAFPARILNIRNTTDKDIIITTDPTNSNGSIDMPAGSADLYNLTANRDDNDDSFIFAAGTQLYAKALVAPTSGMVTMSVVYAKPKVR
jgi:hypothetical protein